MASRKVAFSAADDEQLIEFVAGHRLLWDMSDNVFKNNLKKELAWKEIAGLLNKAGDQCKKRWRNVRDHYKKVKQQENNMLTGSSAPKKRASYWHMLRFLDTVQEERQTISNTKDSEEDPLVDVPEEEIIVPEASEQNLLEETSRSTVVKSCNVKRQIVRRKNVSSLSEKEKSVKKTRKTGPKQELVHYLKRRLQERLTLNYFLQESLKPEPEVEIDLFVKSIGATIKKFDVKMRAEIKSDIFNLVSKYEMNYIRQNSVLGTFATGTYQQPYSSSVTPISPVSPLSCDSGHHVVEESYDAQDGHHEEKEEKMDYLPLTQPLPNALPLNYLP